MAVPTLKASGVTFSQLRTLGLKGHLDKVIAAQTATGNPTTAPTINVTGGGASGGSLAAGAYYAVYTETNGIGETTKSSESTQFTVAAGNIPQFTFPALQSGNVDRKLYLTAVGGASGSEVLYASGITGTTYNASAAAPTGAQVVAPPTTNTTAISSRAAALARTAQENRLDKSFYNATADVDNFMSGAPVPYAEQVSRLNDHAVALQVLATAMNEITALVVANPGTVKTVVDSNGTARKVRTQP
ncbi:hypothetical protein [Singulisphaera sp. PoT]|uniref:hypothetical protein n=1 Tax=Singulisphaera sp. PoT TaxID=3411797 RepID=UPI003BF4E74A